MKSKISRASIAALCFTLVSAAVAQTPYPSRPVTLVAPFAAGGFGDLVSRVIAQGLSDRWKSPVVVDNRPGAAGNVAGSYASRQPADGYTLFLANTATNVINPSIYKKMDFDPQKDFDPVGLVFKSANVLIVNNNLAAKSVAELVEMAKQQPDKLNFGSPGNGTTGHFSGALFNNVAGIRMTTVPYKSTAQLFPDLVSGNVQVTFDNVNSWAPHVKAGKVRALAITSAKRSPLLPDVPTLQELGYASFEAASWAGIAVPAGTPKEIIAKLNADLQAVISAPEFQTRMFGTEVVGGTPQAFRQFIASEYTKWGKVARDIGLTVE